MNGGVQRGCGRRYGIHCEFKFQCRSFEDVRNVQEVIKLSDHDSVHLVKTILNETHSKDEYESLTPDLPLQHPIADRVQALNRQDPSPDIHESIDVRVG